MFNKIKKLKYLLLFMCLIGIGICIKVEKGMLEKNMLYVNEVCTKNLSIVSIGGDKYPDGYIELYNAGEQPIPLNEYFISNNLKKNMRITLPDKVIQPKSYEMLYIENREGGGKG